MMHELLTYHRARPAAAPNGPWRTRGARRLTLAIALLVATGIARADEAAKHRTFDFSYDATVKGLAPGKMARVWTPLPPSTEWQTIDAVQINAPVTPEISTDPLAGNRMFYFEAPADAGGTIHLHASYRVTRREAVETPPSGNEDLSAYLEPNSMIPLGGRISELLAGRTLPKDGVALGKALFDLVDDRMEYRKDKPGWGRGDAVWACDSRFGNCTDFHSLFIALARTEHLPAKFEIGFALPSGDAAADIAGYHCWAWFKPEHHGWIPVDISEANQHPEKRKYLFGHLDEDRVMMTTGRDLTLIPRQSGPPVNFFVYPYVEVDGKPYASSNIQHAFHIEPSPSTAGQKH